MPVVAAAAAVVSSPLTTAAVLLTALPRLRALGLVAPTATDVLDALGVGRSRAYELKARLESRLGELIGAPGRPPAPEPGAVPPSLATEVLRYLAEHPGAIRSGPVRNTYSDGLRLFVLDLLQRHSELSIEACAEAIAIPLGTLKDWLRESTAVQSVEADGEVRARLDPVGPQLQTLLAEWDRWDGSFIAFCDHAQQHCRLPFGRTLIATLLERCGVRTRRRREGRSPDEDALRDAFVTFFPHAQWVGDGSQVPVEVDGERFVFNVELDVDAFSGAFVGASVTLTEDSAAVIDTFDDAIASTRARPLALLLDNKPSNHTDEVHAALDGTLLIRSTPYRPQNKAHVEGGYGLLKPTLAGLVLDTSGTPEARAASFLRCLVIAACRAINHRPRRDRAGQSRLDLLATKPTPEQLEDARRELEALLAKQCRARETLASRQDPVVRVCIADAYRRLALDDPQGHILNATARYSLDAVVEGIAIFEARHRVATLPEGADARYLLGIVRNVAHEREIWALADTLWAQRVAAGDHLALHLGQQRTLIAHDAHSTEALVAAYTDRALATTSRLERFFWLTTTADLITDEAPADHHRLFRLAARRIAATYAVVPRDRNAALRFLAAKIRPLS